METGIISETKIKKTRQTELTSWVFATSNDRNRIIEPLLSRFLILNIPEYTLGEFIHISVCRLEKEQVNTPLAIEIAKRVWKELGSRDVRDVIKVARLANNVEEASFVIRMMKSDILSTRSRER
jgi:Holliday junction DNA helicase RuvB